MLGDGDAGSPASATRYAEAISTAIRVQRQRHRDLTNEEMTAVLQDRDTYFNKVCLCIAGINSQSISKSEKN